MNISAFSVAVLAFTFGLILFEHLRMRTKFTKERIELMDTNAHLDEVNSNLTNNNAILTNKAILLERRVNELEAEKAYLNLTRDSKGILHSIVKKEKKVVKAPDPAPDPELSTKDIAKKYLGQTVTNFEKVGSICGYDKGSILIGLSGNNGHSGGGSTILKEYQSYWFVAPDICIEQLRIK